MKIVSAAPSNTEIIYKLGLENQLVGVTSLCNYPEKVLKKPSIGGWSQGLHYSKIDEINPDIILLSDQLQDKQNLKFQDKGYETLQLTPNSLEEVFTSIKKIGRKFDKLQPASQLVLEMKTEINQVNLQGTRIYCEEWMDPPMVSGNWIPELIQKARGKYFIENSERSREFQLDKLKQFDPEYIFLNVCGAGKNINVDDILERPKWESITAVKNRDVYVVNDALLNRPGPRLVKGLKNIEEKV